MTPEESRKYLLSCLPKLREIRRFILPNAAEIANAAEVFLKSAKLESPPESLAVEDSREDDFR